jgi:hypothetical protein
MTPEGKNKLFGRIVIVLMGVLLAAYMAATFLR